MRTADYADLAAALCNPIAPLPVGICAPAGANLADRFAIYRNNVHVSLVDALAENFPIVRAQVGEDFFRTMAGRYVVERKPVSPLLTYYGEDFAQYVAAFEPAASLPWLPDLARLERAWTESWAAADSPALTIAALHRRNAEELAQSSVRAHPAGRLLCSEWPIADLWEAHQSPDPDLAALEWRPQNVLLTRPQARVLLHCMERDAADFTVALLAGHSIEAAAALAPVQDLGALLKQLIDNGLIQEFCL